MFKKISRPARIVILLILVLLLAGAITFFILYRSSSFVNDNDVTVTIEAFETETENVHAADLYHLDQVVKASDEAVRNTFTLLVIGAEGLAEEVTDDIAESAIEDTADGIGKDLADGITGDIADGITGDIADSPADMVSESEISRKEVFVRPDADAVILMTINHNNKKCLFETLHTNLYVEIPGFGAGRLGNAWAVGGGPLLCRTIEENYGIKIDHYAAVSLRTVARIIGMEEFAELNISEDGLEVVEQLVYSLNARSSIEVASYIARLLPHVSHNISEAEIFGIILKIPTIIDYYSEKAILPYPDLVSEADGYLVPDIKATSERLKSFIYLNP